MATYEGTAGNDTLVGTASNDYFWPRRGDDLVQGGEGRDIVYFDNATSGVAVDLATGVVGGGDGNDTLVGIEDVRGSAFGDSLQGDLNANTLSGDEGDDTLSGRAGDDTLGGFDGADSLAGGEGRDYLAGGSGNDTMDGGAGDDTLRGDAGADLMIGGEGIDTVNYNTYVYPDGTGVVVDLAAGTVMGGFGNDALVGIENVEGSPLSDRLTGDSGANSLFGNGGNDTLEGGAGDDYLLGTGPGYDVASYAHASGPVTVDVRAQTATGADGRDQLVWIEGIVGSDFDDYLQTWTGSGYDVAGGAGNDTLIGGRLDGGPGSDLVNGGFDSSDDTAIFGGQRVDYELLNQGGYITRVSSGNDVDTLVSIERLEFADMGLAFDLGEHDDAATVAQFLAAFFGPQSLANRSYVAIGLDLAARTTSDYDLALFALGAVLGPDCTREDVVALLFGNIVGRSPNAGELAYFASQVRETPSGHATLALMAIHSDLNVANVDLTGLSATGLAYSV
jgi:Ca2+-binding RTX toxin-like protein